MSLVAESSAFKFGSTHKFEFNFSGIKQGRSPPKSPRTSMSSAASPGTPGGAEESDEEVENDEGDHIHFAVSPRVLLLNFYPQTR